MAAVRKRRTTLALGCALMLAPALAARLPAQQPEPLTPAIAGYVIDAELDPATHHLSATAVVSFRAQQSAAPANGATLASPVAFGLNPALAASAVSDENGKTLAAERSADGEIRVTPAAPLGKDQLARWTFAYAGTLAGTNGTGQSPAGQNFAAIAEPVSYLLYPARWFPAASSLSDSLTNRFTAEMRIRVPRGVRVFASGSDGAPKPVMLSDGQPGDEYAFNWTRPGFPGTVIAGRFRGPFTAGAGNVKVWLTAAHQQDANSLAQTAAREFAFFAGSFGAPQPRSPNQPSRLNVVELPDDAPPTAWAPELAAMRGSFVSGKSGERLLANTIARQWWGAQISPRSLNDAWITDGMARLSELLYVENESGKAALQTALGDEAAAALAYDTAPLSSAGRLDPFSPAFQSLTMEKGAMIFHMLRGEMGDKAFLATLRQALQQYSGNSIDSTEFEKLAEAESPQPLTGFFSQWLDSTGAPRYTNTYAIYRLSGGKGYRTIGQIGQDLDLFRMPVELRVEDGGKFVTKTIEVVGASTPYTIDTVDLPGRIQLDPDGWVLKSTPELLVRAAILRGQQRMAAGDLNAALTDYRQALDLNPLSSLVNYRIGEALFAEKNYQAGVNAFRAALDGDGQPSWTAIWSHIQIGKIFDLTGERDRAVNEYRLAMQTGDNSQGGVNQAEMYLRTPFKLPVGQ